VVLKSRCAEILVSPAYFGCSCRFSSGPEPRSSADRGSQADTAVKNRLRYCTSMHLVLPDNYLIVHDQSMHGST
jgi:hypothetical protein